MASLEYMRYEGITTPPDLGDAFHSEAASLFAAHSSRLLMPTTVERPPDDDELGGEMARLVPPSPSGSGGEARSFSEDPTDNVLEFTQAA